MYSGLVKNLNSVKENIPKYSFTFVDGPSFTVSGAYGETFNVQFKDKKTGIVHHNGNVGNCNFIKANKSYYIDWEVKVIRLSTGEEFIYNLDLRGKRVFIVFESRALGDNLAWLPYVEEFRKKWDCEIYCSTFWNHLFRDQYPNINFLEPGSGLGNLTALYRLGWFYNEDGSFSFSRVPNNFRLQPMQKTASDILGLEFEEIKPNIKLEDNVVKEKIVSIAIHGTAQSKYWNNESGWQEVVNFLNGKGYRVILLSHENDGHMGNRHPDGIEQLEKGDIYGVIRTLQKSEFFIGIGSGLSWLSWAVGTKSIIISGFSYKYTEPLNNVIRIETPLGKCTGCFNNHKLSPSDWHWCPIYKDTENHYECSKSITGQMVIDEIKKSGLI